MSKSDDDKGETIVRLNLSPKELRWIVQFLTFLAAVFSMTSRDHDKQPILRHVAERIREATDG